MSNYYDVKQFVVPDSLKTSMNSVLNKKLGTTSVNYDPKTWAANVGAMVPLPTKTATGAIASFSDGADDVPLKSCVCTINPTQSGTGDPSPSNPRPIHGRTSCTVEQRGVNWFDINSLSATGITINEGVASGVISAFHTAFSNGIYANNLPNAQMTLSFDACTDGSQGTSGNGLLFGFMYADGTKERVACPNTTNAYTRFNITSNANKTLINLYITYQSTGNNTWYIKNVMLEKGSTPSTYEAYHGTTTAVPLGQEVYGGSLEVVGGVGEVTLSDLDLSSLEWTYSSTYQRFSTTSQVAGIKTPPNNNTVANILCSHFKPDTSNNTEEVGKDNIIGVSMTGVIQIRDTSLNGDISALMTLLGNVDFVYELATPTGFTFEGEEVRTFLGVNNFYNNCGGDTEVEYRADLILGG